MQEKAPLFPCSKSHSFTAPTGPKTLKAHRMQVHCTMCAPWTIYELSPRLRHPGSWSNPCLSASMDWQYYGGLAGALLGLAVALAVYTQIVLRPALKKYT